MTGKSSAPLVALAAGGTGGHLFPAEALAQELKRRGRGVLLVTDTRGARFAERFPADARFEISAASPSVGGPVAKAAAALSLAGGLLTSLREFRQRTIAAAVGFGGYPSLPAMKAASIMGVPYGLHEQNGVLGRSNRMLADGARFLAHAFPVLEKAPARISAKLKEVGNPVRDAVAALAGDPFEAPSGDGEIRVLIFGGSQGASLFSRVAPAAIARLPAPLKARLRITQQVRDDEREAVRRAYAEAGVACDAQPFFVDLPARVAGTHLAIARAGASTVTELSLIGRPSILVPLAIAMDDHQTGNARTLGDAGGAVMLAERDFTPERLADELLALLPDANRLAAMARAASGRVRSGAAGALADLVDELIEFRMRRAA